MSNPYTNSTNIIPSIVTISLNAHLTAIVYGLINFGDAIVFFMIHEAIGHFFPQLTTIPGVAEEDQLRSVIFLIALRSFAQASLAVKLIFKDAKWEVLKYVAPVASATCVIGCLFLDSFIHTWWMRPLLGVIFGIFGVITLGIRIRKSMLRKERKRQRLACNSTTVEEGELAEMKQSKPPSQNSSAPPVDSSTTTSNGNENNGNNDDDDDECEADDPGSPPSEFVHAAQVVCFETATNDPETESAAELPPTAATVTTAIVATTTKTSISANSPDDAEDDDEEKRQNDKVNDPNYLTKVRGWIIFAGALAGWLGGSINVGGPPFIVVSLILEFPREFARATFPFITFAIYSTRFAYTLATGSFFDPTIFSIPHAIGVVSASLVGLYIGDRLGRIVTNEQYLQVASILLICAAFSIGGTSIWITWGVFAVCSVWFAWTNFFTSVVAKKK